MNQTVKCKTCGDEFLFHGIDDGGLADRIRIAAGLECSPCSTKSAAANKAQEELERMQRIDSAWKELCPREYRTHRERGQTDPERLTTCKITATDGSAASLEDLTFAWDGNDYGIWITGASGTMKTRAAWRVCRKAVEAGKTVRAFTAWTWQASYQDATGKFETQSWMTDVCRSGLVFIDDIGKSYWSVSASSAFFEMIERRTNSGKPVLFTSNHGRGDIGKMFDSSKSIAIQGTADAITRRLKEYFRAYLFQAAQ